MDQIIDKRKLQVGFAAAGAITKKYAKTYYFASRFLPHHKRIAAFSIYAICRISDDAVDNSLSRPSQEMIADIQKNIYAAYRDDPLNNPILMSFRQTIRTYNIPKEYFDELITGMHMDLNKTRYKNFAELYPYCYKVAGVVGLIMLKVFGYKDEAAQVSAVNLGIAMQLTNILRDIKEDFTRGRIYLPLDEMEQYDVPENNISHAKIDENFKSFMKSQIGRARNYYAESEKGIGLINNRSCRFTVLSIKEIYAGILTKIEKNNYDVFSGRAYLKANEKISAALGILLQGRFI